MQLSALTESVLDAKSTAVALADNYESDADLVDLKERAVLLRDRAQNLVDAFDGINSGLGLL